MDLTPWLPTILAVVVFLISGWSYWKTAPYRPVRKIDPEIQAEIDQTPEWWDREFRRLQGLPEPQTTPYGVWSPGGTSSWGWEMEYRIDSLSEQREDS